MATQAPTRDLTITLPEILVEQVQQLARAESTDVSSLVARLIREQEWKAFEAQLNFLRPPHNPEHDSITEEDIEAMVDELRAERLKASNQAR